MKDKRTFVENKSEWIRDIKAGQVKTGYFRTPWELDSVSTLVSRFNQTYGAQLGVRLTGQRNWKERSYTIKCIKLKEHEAK